MEANNKVIDDYTNVVNKHIVDDIIINDKYLFKDHVKNIAKSIIDESPYIRYGQAVFNYVDEKYGVARIAQFDYGIDCFYDDTKIEQFLDKCYELIKTVNRND
jgi:hypothetical protein